MAEKGNDKDFQTMKEVWRVVKATRQEFTKAQKRTDALADNVVNLKSKGKRFDQLLRLKKAKWELTTAQERADVLAGNVINLSELPVSSENELWKLEIEEVGDRSQALKFISKARRLDPTLPVYDLSSEIEKESNGPGDPQPQGSSGSTNNGTSEPSKPSDQPSVRHQGPSSSSASSASASASYTENRDREAD
nr:hypothetical protein CFP56_68226 [Quercus suber]